MTSVPEANGPGPVTDAETASPLTAEASALVEALARKSQKSRRAIDMYLEARRAMTRRNQESLHVAGYEMREFMNALPRALDLPIVPHQQLNSRLQVFVAECKIKARSSACLRDGEWDGSIDRQLKLLLESLMSFVKWVEEHVPSRRAEAVTVLHRLAPTTYPYPLALVNIRANEWRDLLRYFNGCAHHESDPDPVEFQRQVEALEQFLLDHLEPRTFEDQDEIDRLIQEVDNR